MPKVIVLDTNVFVSALLGPRGMSRELLRRCLLGRYQPLMGTTLFLEYESLLARDELFETCQLDRSVTTGLQLLEKLNALTGDELEQR